MSDDDSYVNSSSAVSPKNISSIELARYIDESYTFGTTMGKDCSFGDAHSSVLLHFVKVSLFVY